MAVAVGEQRRKKEAMDMLVNEIIKGEDEGVVLQVRVAIERGWLKNFKDSLNDAKKKKEAEIDRICYRHYGEFLGSVDELLKMRGSASHLTGLVSSVHKNLNTTGGELVQVLEDLNKIQTERVNTRQLLEATLHCKDVAELMVKTRAQIESDDHYGAMRTIETIQAELTNIAVKPMIKCLESWLPIAINKLLYGALTEAAAFLQVLRSKIDLIGRTVLLRQALISLQIDPKTTNRNRSTNNDGSSNGKSSLRPSTISLYYIHLHDHVFRLNKWYINNNNKNDDFDRIVPEHFTSLPTSDGKELVDKLFSIMAPLHKVLHLYAILGNLSSYHEHYRNARETEFNRILKIAERKANQFGLVVAIPAYFENLVGFFTIESVARRCVEISEGVFSYEELSNLWDRACAHIQELCTSLGMLATSPDEFLLVKEEILLLIETMSDEGYELKASTLYDVMRNLWDTFQTLQIGSLLKSCAGALENCAYQPLYVSNDEVFNSQIRAFRLDVIELNNEETYSRPLQSNNRSQLHQRDNKSMSIGTAAANLDALEEGLEIGLTSTISSTIPSQPDPNDYYNEQNDDKITNNNKKPIIRNNNNNNNSQNHNSRTNIISTSRVFMAQTFPFSAAVPILMKELHIIAVRFFIFLMKNNNYLNTSEYICKSMTNAIGAICKSLSHELTKDGSDTPLSKACQISIDVAAIVLAADHLWTIIENGLVSYRFTEKLDLILSTAINQSNAQLRLIINQAQDLIFELLSNKIEDLLGSLVFINFEPDVLPSSSHDSVDEVIEFLTITFMCLTHLPKSIREAVHFTCCSRVANGIINYILSNRVQSINALSLLAFEYDTKKLMIFAESCGIIHLKQCFEEFQELIRAVLHPDLPLFGDNQQLRKSLFPHLSPMKLASLLDKVSPSSIVASSNNIPRLERTMVKTVAKKLRTQMKDNQNHG
eukprot:gene11269-15120_t